MVASAFRYLRNVVVLTAVWVVLNERLTPLILIAGVVVSAIALFTTNRLILKGSYRRQYPFRLRSAALYGVRLVIAIYVAGFHAVRQMVTGNIGVRVVDVTTDLENDFAVSLLANSITLTPGTVTLDRDGQCLRVLWLTTTVPDQEETNALVKGQFEPLLREVTR